VQRIETAQRLIAGLGRQFDGDVFDPEIAVRMVWAGVPTVNLRTRVRYLPREEGGVSHFHLFRDNARISWMHTRLVALALLRLLRLEWLTHIKN